MEEYSSEQELGIYDTAIKDISGLKDYSIIFGIMRNHFADSNTLDKVLHQNNEFDIRTERTRTKVGWAIKRSFLQFCNQDHEDIIYESFNERIPVQDRNLVFLWQFALNNRLFREITSGVFVKVYFSGRVSISHEDISAFIKEVITQKKELQSNWSDNTIYRLSTKYLSLMTKMGFVSSGRVKSFQNIRPSSEALVLFLYFATLYSPNSNNVLMNEFLPLNFVPSEDFIKRLKKLSVKGLFNMNYNGVALNIELIHSYKGICDVLYN